MTPDISRRSLLSGLTGLASLAVVPSTLLPIAGDDVDAFLREARAGAIEGKTFVLDRQVIVSDLPRLVIRNCTFIDRIADGKAMFRFRSGCSITMEHNRFLFASAKDVLERVDG